MSWRELTKIALLGTERGTLSPELKAQLEAKGLDTTTFSATLVLQGAAIYNQIRKAAFPIPAFKGKIPAVLDLEKENPCSAQSARHFELILNGVYEEALEEFIFQVVKNKKSLPPESLPGLFYKCLHYKGLWQMVKPAIGQRGKWLLHLNPEWQPLRIVKDAALWETGSKTERLNLLSYLREKDPEKAIILLRKTWNEDVYSDKTDFLEMLIINLSRQDEVFLEHCLKDKRKEVRQKAAQLLTLIAGSKLVKKMFELCVGSMRWKRGAPLELILPSELPREALFYGIDPSSKGHFKGGMKTGWISQMIARIPPAYWEGYFKKDPVGCFEIFAASPWREPFLDALTWAIGLHRDEKWMEALLTYWMEHSAEEAWKSTVGKKLLEVIPDRLFNAVAIGYLKEYGPLCQEDSLVGDLLCLAKHHWEDRLALLVISGFRNWAATAGTFHWNIWHYKRILRAAAFCCRPGLLDKLKKGWSFGSGPWPDWEQDIEQFLKTLFFRKEMIGELEGPFRAG